MSTTYKIEKIPNDKFYGIYATNKEFADGFGGTTILVKRASSIEDAEKKIAELKKQNTYSKGGLLSDSEFNYTIGGL